jgi:hypothetical protein
VRPFFLAWLTLALLLLGIGSVSRAGDAPAAAVGDGETGAGLQRRPTVHGGQRVRPTLDRDGDSR